MTEQLRKLAGAATPGPWKQHLVDDTCVTTGQCDVCTTFPEGGIDDDVDFNTDVDRRERDAAFIAAANPSAVIAILDEKDALTARVAELEKMHKPCLSKKARASLGELCEAMEAMDDDTTDGTALRMLLEWHDRRAAQEMEGK